MSTWYEQRFRRHLGVVEALTRRGVKAAEHVYRAWRRLAVRGSRRALGLRWGASAAWPCRFTTASQSTAPREGGCCWVWGWVSTLSAPPSRKHDESSSLRGLHRQLYPPCGKPGQSKPLEAGSLDAAHVLIKLRDLEVVRTCLQKGIFELSPDFLPAYPLKKVLIKFNFTYQFCWRIPRLVLSIV